MSAGCGYNPRPFEEDLLMRVSLCVAVLGVLFPVIVSGAEAKVPEGVLPVGADGNPLNLDFETGDLKDWTASGDAFAGQPIQGDVVQKRRTDMKSQNQGKYWVGTFEVAGDKGKGTLSSVPFKVTQPWASFLISGGAHDTTRVEVVLSEKPELVILKANGSETENMARVVVDLRKFVGKEIFVRVVDGHTAHWGHINFDDFRFHSTEPKFPAESLAKLKPPPPPLDEVKYSGVSPEEAVKAITLPEGFKATLFAGEPQVTQPVAFCIDARGRVWVAEAHNYPKKGKDGEGKDRIIIFEDADNDGRADKRTVFTEGLNLVSGMEVGFGGVWVGQAPHLLFIADKDGDDKPDGAPEVLLDGWAFQDTHETLNAFTWGPDGWLYGCHGVFTHSKVGKPGAPDSERTPLNAGVWRYHPTKRVFELFAEGTSNPWGVDFNDHGQAFITACVIPHLFHVIQGARYQRQAGQHFNPYTFKDIGTIADHVHWAGSGGPHAGNNRSDAAGGGHAHCGAMIYLGGTWPEKYRNTILMANIHGNRLNQDILEPRGSGYVGKHGPDFMKMNDKWSRLINFKYGPDGNVYAIDWYDAQACHLNQPEKFDRGNGRIYKVSFEGGEARRHEDTKKDLSKLSDAELVALQGSANEFFVRGARRILQERGAKGAIAALKEMLGSAKDDAKRLRALWALHAVGGVDEALLLSELKHESPYVRGWVIQLACEEGRPSERLVAEFVRMAKEDKSQVVRLYLASAVQRMPAAQRWDILKGLVSHAEDAADHNLPLMYWYGLEPLVGLDKAKALTIATTGKVPVVREFATRRLAGAAAKAPEKK
jgi:putative membrane-bound dehydrogenase-like protein